MIGDEGNRLRHLGGAVDDNIDGVGLPLFGPPSAAEVNLMLRFYYRDRSPSEDIVQGLQTVVSRKIVLRPVMKIVIATANSGGRRLMNGTSIDSILEQR